MDTSTRSLLASAAERATRYLENVRERCVAPEHVEDLVRLGGPLPADPEDAGDLLALLDEAGSPATVAMNGPRYFGFVIGAALPVCIATQYLAAAWDQNAGLRVMSPVAAAVEDIALSWLRELLHLPDGCAGAFVTGATMANFTGLAAARHIILRRQGWDVEAQGLFGAPPIQVVVGAEAHVSLLKALALVGLGRDRVTIVPVDEQGRMRADGLPRLNANTIVCLQAGNVNSGAFDPAREICAAAGEHGSWVHVDGAFGLWAAADPACTGLLDGFEQADSWATDAHKWLNVPYDSGLAFVRESLALSGAMSATAAYLHPGGEREPMYYTPDMSRRARGIEIWAALRSLGRSGVVDLVRRCCEHARRFAAGLSAAGYEVLNDVVLNQVLVSFGDDAKTRSVIVQIQNEGTCWCGGTIWRGRIAMRISVSSWMTTTEDVDRSLDAMLRIAGIAS
jgi:glutamate/tyrosine decarboxylase-like PLP-dependent enzyme